MTVSEELVVAADKGLKLLGKPPASTPIYLEILPVILISLVLFGVLWFTMRLAEPVAAVATRR